MTPGDLRTLINNTRGDVVGLIGEIRDEKFQEKTLDSEMFTQGLTLLTRLAGTMTLTVRAVGYGRGPSAAVEIYVSGVTVVAPRATASQVRYLRRRAWSVIGDDFKFTFGD